MTDVEKSVEDGELPFKFVLIGDRAFKCTLSMINMAKTTILILNNVPYV